MTTGQEGGAEAEETRKGTPRVPSKFEIRCLADGELWNKKVLSGRGTR